MYRKCLEGGWYPVIALVTCAFNEVSSLTTLFSSNERKIEYSLNGNAVMKKIN